MTTLLFVIISGNNVFNNPFCLSSDCLYKKDLSGMDFFTLQVFPQPVSKKAGQSCLGI